MSFDASTQEAEISRSLTDVAFVGLNSRVIAVDRYTGEIVWKWKSPKGKASYVAVLLDGDRLIVSVNGYVYGLDPITGEQLWFNPLKGYGLGTASICSLHGNTGSAAAAAIIARQQAGAAAAAGSGS